MNERCNDFCRRRVVSKHNAEINKCFPVEHLLVTYCCQCLLNGVGDKTSPDKI